MTNSSLLQFQSDLRKGIFQTFSTNDLRTLCADLAIEYEDLAGDTKEGKVLDLIGYVNRRGRTTELLTYCMKQRPNYAWPQEGGAVKPTSPIHEVPAASQEVIILFLAADPSDASRLRLGQELREIQEKLQLAAMRDKFHLEQRMSVRPADISQALLDTKPQIVHFSGHGSAAGAVYFEDVLGHAQAAQPEALAELFALVADEVDCVLLNACYSEAQAKAISAHINYVIGMNKEIGDEAAIAFAIGFYQALGGGRSIQDAYKFGCVQIGLQGIPEHLTPVLLTKGVQLPAQELGTNP